MVDPQELTWDQLFASQGTRGLRTCVCLYDKIVIKVLSPSPYNDCIYIFIIYSAAQPPAHAPIFVNAFSSVCIRVVNTRLSSYNMSLMKPHIMTSTRTTREGARFFPFRFWFTSFYSTCLLLISLSLYFSLNPSHPLFLISLWPNTSTSVHWPKLPSAHTPVTISTIKDNCPTSPFPHYRRAHHGAYILLRYGELSSTASFGGGEGKSFPLARASRVHAFRTGVVGGCKKYNMYNKREKEKESWLI